MRSRVVLTFTEGPLTGRAFTFTEKDIFVFGRGLDCHASVDSDSYLSRHHFAIEVAPPMAHLRDLGSRNGTFLNQTRLGGRKRGALPPAEGASIPPPCSPFAAALLAHDARPIQLDLPLHHGDVVRAGRSALTVTVVNEDIGEYLRSLSAAGRGDTVTIDEGEVPQIAGYRLLRELGKGATGSTWLARRQSDDFDVALKLVQLGGDVAAVSGGRIEREVGLLLKLHHPNIVRLIASGEFGGFLWLALEFCEGGSLGQLLEKRGSLPFDEARPIACGLLEGLALAHAQGVVHRDIKPDNILLTTDAESGVVVAKVADFGLSKIVGSLTASSTGNVSGGTMSGATAGTPGFMPREQILTFRSLRPPSDVWSAGATIYRMMTGALPRQESPSQDVLATILEGRIVPIRERLPTLDANVAAVIDRALAVLPADRYSDAGAMLADLRAACDQGGDATPPA